MSKTMRIMISTGHLGTTPANRDSFIAGIDTMPDFLVADGGSSDPGPVYLGEDTQMGMFAWEDLEMFLVESRKRGIPLIVGSSGDTGSNGGVDLYVKMIQEIAEKHRIPKFKIGYFYSEVPAAYLKKKLAAGKQIAGLGGFPDLTVEEIDQATRIVAVAGIHPFIKLLDMGADVILGGRCGDINFTAAPCIRAGFPDALAYHMGKMIECASLVAEPFKGKETVIGTISQEDIKITPYHPEQRCTVASAAAHSMYERENPFYEHTLGGLLDMSGCRYEQFDERTCKISGAKFTPAPELRVKLEGAKKIGERYMAIVGVRDPHIIANIDAAMDYCRTATAKQFAGQTYELYFHVFGRNAVLKDLEPVKHASPHELGVVIEVVAPDDLTAQKATDFAARTFFLLRIPGMKGTAGGGATTKKPLKNTPGYRWNVNHTVPIDDPMELFPCHMTTGGI